MSNSRCVTLDELTIRIRLERATIELFTIPVPVCQLEFAFEHPSLVRVFDNPLEDNLRNYVVWGRL